MILVQKWTFFQVFSLGNMWQENVFYDILEQKTPFQAIKTRSSKSRKIDIFPKGLAHGFRQNMTIFATFCFYAINARKMFLRYDIVERKSVFLEYKNKKFKNMWRQRGRVVSTSDSQSGGPGFESRSGHLLDLCSVVPSSNSRPRL